MTYDKDHLKDPDKCLEEFARFNHELEQFRAAFKQAADTKEYLRMYFETARADLLTDNGILAELKLLPNKEDREAELWRILEAQHKDEYDNYQEARSNLEGYEAAFKVIDVQRSIVQSAIKIHERKR